MFHNDLKLLHFRENFLKFIFLVFRRFERLGARKRKEQFKAFMRGSRPVHALIISRRWHFTSGIIGKTKVLKTSKVKMPVPDVDEDQSEKINGGTSQKVICRGSIKNKLSYISSCPKYLMCYPFWESFLCAPQFLPSLEALFL